MTWTPLDVVLVGLALSGAATTAAVTVIAAIKGNAAQAQAIAAQVQADANHEAIGALTTRVQAHDQQLNSLATRVGLGATTGQPTVQSSSDPKGA